MPQLRYLTSWSRAGLSIIKVEMRQEFWADRLPQVWDEMRRKVNDARDYGEKRVGELEGQVGEHPLGSVLAAFGIGFVIAKLMDLGGRR